MLDHVIEKLGGGISDPEFEEIGIPTHSHAPDTPRSRTTMIYWSTTAITGHCKMNNIKGYLWIISPPICKSPDEHVFIPILVIHIKNIIYLYKTDKFKYYHSTTFF